MQTISSIMLSEHENILAVVKSLEQKIESLEDNFEIDDTYYSSVLHFLRKYADGVHHAKEEDILFRTVTEIGLDKQDEEIKRLVHQHIISRDIFERVELSLANSNRKKLIKDFKQYIEMIRAHIKEEDELLFPLLEGLLSKTIKERILIKFKKADDAVQIAEYLKLKDSIIGSSILNS